MKLFKKFVFWMHLVAGLSAGVIVLVMAFTGIMLAYERQIIEWADGFQLPDSAALGIPELLAANPGPLPSAITFEKRRPVAFQYGREKTEYIDPSSGKSLGEGNTAVRSFFTTMVHWHRWLGREGASRPVGKLIIGVGNLFFLFLLISGIILWIPRRWTKPNLRAITLLKGRLKGRARDWRLHNFFGFWAAIPLLIIIPCGTVISFPWATAIVFKIAGEKPPEGGEKRGGKRTGGKAPSEINASGLDAALATVKQANPDWQSIQLQLPPRKTASFTVADSHRGRPDKRRQLEVDLASGNILKSEGFETFTTGRKARTWIRWIHTGEAGGIAGQTIAGLAAASSIVLVWTGFALSWRRFTKRKRATAS